MKSQEKTGIPALGTLRPGTRQRSQLRVRVADIAWTALCVVLALWAVASSVGVVRGMTAWVYCAVAWILLAVAGVMLLASVRRGKRL
ncbi:hypothetical protein [Streptomyces naphthomycinicus]|uniref:hypothetical protein n=1 Tax=Streptomyces naphthomycinicus TaxID=2872625 RepID=UPI001CEC3C96|nr:hypothetical protein [Streptomyces sp. TML10]